MAKRRQTQIVGDTFDGLLNIFIRDAKEYKEALLKSVSNSRSAEKFNDQFFRDLAFTAFNRVAEKNVDENNDAAQIIANLQETKRLLEP